MAAAIGYRMNVAFRREEGVCPAAHSLTSIGRNERGTPQTLELKHGTVSLGLPTAWRQTSHHIVSLCAMSTAKNRQLRAEGPLTFYFHKYAFE
jgi:hypothetical protein